MAELYRRNATSAIGQSPTDRSAPALIAGGNGMAWWYADVARQRHCRHDKAMMSEAGKLPKGQSYPLKPSVLEAALATANIEVDTHLIRSPGKMFDAHFWPANANVQHERLYVRAGSVPADEATEARDRIEAEALPALVKWIGNILAQDPQSPLRREQHRLDLIAP